MRYCTPGGDEKFVWSKGSFILGMFAAVIFVITCEIYLFQHVESREQCEVDLAVASETIQMLQFDVAGNMWMAEEERDKREKCEFQWDLMAESYAWCEEIVMVCGKECVHDYFGPGECQNMGDDGDCNDIEDRWCPQFYKGKAGPDYFGGECCADN